MNEVTGNQYCGACGNANGGAARFCQRCGAPLGAGATQQAQPSPYAAQSGGPAPYAPPPLPPQVITQQQWTAVARTQAAMGRSYVTPAVITFVLYWLFWLPGFIVNLVYISQANNDKRVAGSAPDGLGCLWALLWVFVIVPVVLGILFVAGAFAAFSSH